MAKNWLSIASFPTKPLWPFPAWMGFIPSPPVPELYFNTVSTEQRWKTLCCDLKKLVEYAQQLGVNVNLTYDMITKLEAEFEKFKESGFIDYYEAQIRAWINANMDALLHSFADVVFFGLTDDGRFCAYIPEGWQDIEFDTGTAGEKYGHLILRYDVAAQAVGAGIPATMEIASVIDNTDPYYGEDE